MKLKIQTDFSSVVVFFENIVEIVNSALVGEKYNDDMSNMLNEMINIVNETTGLIIIPKYRNSALYLEISNLRSMETAFFIASNSHEISEASLIDFDVVGEKYEKSVKELCEKAKLTKFTLDFTWQQVKLEDETIMLLSVILDLPPTDQLNCFSRLNTFLNEKLKLDWR